MSEADGIVETLEPAESYLDGIEGLSDENRELFTKKNYPDIGTALNSSADTFRMVGKSVRFPDEKSTDEDRAAFDAKIHAYQGVAEKPEDFEFDRSSIPEHIEYDEDMDGMLRQWGIDKKVPKSAVTDLHALYSKAMLARHEAMETKAKEAEDGLRKEMGKDFEVVFGKEGDEKNIGTLKTGLMQLSKDLKLDYKDDEGNLQSHLLDSLEFVGKKGSAGNNPHLAKAMSYLLNYRYAEARTQTGEPFTSSKGKGGALSDDFYDNPEPGGEVI